MYEYSINGNYQFLNDIKLELNKNQITKVTFNWDNIYRDYRYICIPNKYDFRLVLTLNSVLLPNNNLLTILRSEKNQIHIVENEELNQRLIVCNIVPEITNNLRDYDSGYFSLDMRPKSSDDDYDFSRLVGGRWGIKSNQIPAITYTHSGEEEYIMDVTYTDVNDENNMLSGLSFEYLD